MRDFIDAILAFIGSESLTDLEWETITIEAQVLTIELYNEILAVLVSRESVSTTIDRLTKYFEASGLTITPPSLAKSEIYLGSVL